VDHGLSALVELEEHLLHFWLVGTVDLLDDD
jgi:hypothetical protein